MDFVTSSGGFKDDFLKMLDKRYTIVMKLSSVEKTLYIFSVH